MRKPVSAALSLDIASKTVRRPRSLFSIGTVLGLALKEASFQRRGFKAEKSLARQTLEKAGETFINGYNAALVAGDADAIVQTVSSVPLPQRGFAVEGAAMGIAIVDSLPFRRPLLPACIEAFMKDFTYLAHVGAGWALARVPWRCRHILEPLDPIHWWLAFDGLGFHDAYFYHRRVIGGWRRRQAGYAARVYDQGIGRALWFVCGGSIIDAAELISAFPTTRHVDLWSGIGLAMAYAGPIDDRDVFEALPAAGTNASQYAQGIAFACEARCLEGHVPEHTKVAARAVAGRSAEALAALVRDVRARLPKADGDPPRYEIWRRDIAGALQHVGGRRS